MDKFETKHSYKTNFVSLSDGDIFYDNLKNTYVKIKIAFDENNNEINAIALLDGSHKKFDLYDSVYKFGYFRSSYGSEPKSSYKFTIIE